MIQALEEMITLLYPRRCPLCQDILTDKAALICMKCRTKAVPIRGPKCKTCGKPVASLETEYCPDCQEKTHFFTSGRAVFLYEKEIRKSVYQFKFHNKREYAGFYVSEMERVCGDEIRTWNPDVIIPIPMYKRKKRQRGYNQAEILAKCLGKRLQMGETSYITQALTAVLQLGVTMDYSIFLLNSYEENKKRFPGEKDRAMGHAIANTFKSVAGSSVTTVAGFVALCVMTFALGRDLGIVMAKGVVIGVVCCVTILPALVLFFDKPIEKTQHKLLFSRMDKPSAFITKHYKAWVVIFLVLLFPAIYGNNHTQIYYNIAESLPATLDCNIANNELEKTFAVGNIHMVMMDNDMDPKQKQKMLSEIDEVEGVKWSLGMNSLIGSTVPESMIPSDLKKIFKGDQYELAFVCSEYESATDEVNAQLAKINEIVKKYDDTAMVIGEAPLMKDLQDTTDADLVRVNVISIGAIFLIILIIFKSISLPIILVAVIEFAIFVNMAIPFYQGISLPFVASIVIGAIQLGATVDYAILMTTRYQRERQHGKDKKEAISIAHKTSMPSIISSGLSFFAATFGVSCYSQVEMIGSICTLLARGAIISMVVVLFILPAMFMIFDKLICVTSIGFLGDKKAAKAK